MCERMSTAVIVIDMINDFVRGKFGFPGAREVIPRIAKLLSAARKRDFPVIYACDSHTKEDREIKIWGEHAMRGSEGSRIIPELAPKPKDIVLTKRTYDAFFDTPLEKILKENNVGQVVLVGVVTDICIQHSAAGAFFRGFVPIIPEDCVSSPGKNKHLSALEYMKSIYGGSIVKSEDLILEWEGQ